MTGSDRTMARLMQSLFAVVYPRQCLMCGNLVETDKGLCGPCWRDMPFITGSACCTCGAPLMGQAWGDDDAQCDDCMTLARPWDRGAAALIYRDNGRKLVLALKHGDRQDLVAPAAAWMRHRLGTRLTDNTLVVPIPIHWRRMVRRRHNQSALLAYAVARDTPAQAVPDALVRIRHTPVQDGKNVEARFANQHGAIAMRPGRAAPLAGRDILLIDDVMTSGATLAAATEALRAGGVGAVNVLTLARVVKDA